MIMNRTYERSRNSYMGRSQKGATLLVALVLLAVVTIIGISGMQSSTLEVKMVASSLERSRAFTTAEAAISRVEARLFNNIDDLGDLMQGECVATANKPCFTENCDDGYCFEGTYDNDMQYRLECQIDPADDSPRRLFWKDSVVVDDGVNPAATGSVWDLGQYAEIAVKSKAVPELDADNNPVLDGDGNAVLDEEEDTDVKYIVEFLCFTSSSPDIDFSFHGDPDAGDPLFRITVLMDAADSHPIMLQSTYAFPI